MTIGITFVITLLVAGRWAYTDVLSDLAQAMSGRTMVVLPLLLVAALFAGSIWGGRRRVPRPATTITALCRCLAGGAVMGAGSSLIPGSNDGLIPVGLPLRRGYAWLAFASMCATILLALWLQGQWRGRWRGRWYRRAT